jgi:hypothetical protein
VTSKLEAKPRAFDREIANDMFQLVLSIAKEDIKTKMALEAKLIR